VTSPTPPALLAAQSRLASQTATRRLEQSRALVAASQQSCAASRQAVTGPHAAPAARAHAGQPAEQPRVDPAPPPGRTGRIDEAP
jgi:hypothetical protein